MIKKYLPWLLLLGLAYFPLFLHLDTLSLSIWDEARRACNAFEMTQNGNWLVTHFDGKPEMWGTKPPFLIWMQATLMKVIGYNELAVRLPSALAGLALVGVFMHFGIRTMKSWALGVAAIFVLLTTDGFVDFHVTRTGDFDALLSLWLSLYLLSFYRYTQGNDADQRRKYLYYTVLFVGLATFTKGIAGLFFLPSLFVFALLERQLLPTLTNKHTYFGIAAFLIFILGFYFLREAYNPGYLKAVWENELGGRYVNALEGNEQPFWFYFKLIASKEFLPWLWWLPLGLFLGFTGTKKERSLTSLLLVNSILFLLIISNAGTKHAWYNAPVYPSLALICALGISKIYTQLNNQLTVRPNLKTFIGVVFFLAIFGYPYANIIEKVHWPKPQYGEKHSYANYMRSHTSLDHCRVGNINYNANNNFYVHTLKAQGKDINMFYPGNKQSNTSLKYLLCGGDAKERFYKIHEAKVVEWWEDCELVEITGYK